MTTREYYQKNRKHLLQIHKKYRDKHKKEILERQRNFRIKNKKILNEKRREDYKKRPSYYRKITNNHKIKRRMSLFNFLCNGNICCQKCSFRDIRALQLDHVKNDGSQDRKRFKNENNFYFYYYNHYLEAKEKLQVLCANCNTLKRTIIVHQKRLQNNIV